MLTIYIPRVPPSPNERKYKNHFAYRDLRNLWERELYLAVPAKQRHEIMDFARCCKMKFTAHMEVAQLRDPDNLPACLKPVLDALRRVGFIHNDNVQWLQIDAVTQSLTGGRKNGGTKITLSPIHKTELDNAA